MAGGQGSRLGFEHAKGLYNINMPSQKTLFEYFAMRIKRISSLGNFQYYQMILKILTSKGLCRRTGLTKNSSLSNNFICDDKRNE